MKINKNSLQERINRISKEKSIHANYVLKNYFFDCFIERLSKSDYSKKFIFKGGFFLSTKLGLENRATIDIDFLAYQTSIEKRNIEKIIKEIIVIDNDDNVSFQLCEISDIRKEDIYGGYNVILEARLENIKDRVSIDIATGDPITPCASSFKYYTLIDNEELDFMSYNFETILAEKIQTIIVRGVLNSRCKDFYDVYIINKLKWNEIDINQLRKAFNNTCNYRHTLFTKEEIELTIKSLKESKEMNLRWNAYAKKNSFAKGVAYLGTIMIIERICQLLVTN